MPFATEQKQKHKLVKLFI